MGMVIISQDEGYAPAITPSSMPLIQMNNPGSSWILPAVAIVSLIVMIAKK